MLMVDFDHKLREVSDTFALILFFHLSPVLRMMLSLDQFVLRRAINGAVHVYYPITKVVQGLFPEEKLPVVEVGRRVNG
jgi:hypothetical protein